MLTYIFAALIFGLGLYLYFNFKKRGSVIHPPSHVNVHSHSSKKNVHEHKHNGGHGCC